MDNDVAIEMVKKNNPVIFEDCDFELVKSRLPGCVRKSFNNGRWEDWNVGEDGQLVHLVGKGEKF